MLQQCLGAVIFGACLGNSCSEKHEKTSAFTVDTNVLDLDHTSNMTIWRRTANLVRKISGTQHTPLGVLLFVCRSSLTASSIFLQGSQTRAGASPWPRKYCRLNVQLLQNRPPHLRQWCYKPDLNVKICTINHLDYRIC